MNQQGFFSFIGLLPMKDHHSYHNKNDAATAAKVPLCSFHTPLL